jgi:hypothetical protein
VRISRRSAVLLALGLPALVGATAAAVAVTSGPGDATREPGRATAIETPVFQHHNHKHAQGRGHLPATRSNVDLVSTVALKSGPRKRIADVAVHRGYAYLGSWSGPCRNNGVHVVDIRDPERPTKVAFLPAPRGSYPGEGVQVLRVETKAFAGDILVTNNETCDRRRRLGGLNIYDVSSPHRPKKLLEGFGDHTVPGEVPSRAAHDIHSVFAWQARKRAYAVLVDNREARDVDIVEITNPGRPTLVAEYDLSARFPQILQARPRNLVDVFHHDVVVRRVGRRQVMLISYWDGGYVTLDVTDPRRARYIGDSDVANPDPELLAQAGLRERPEGNAHQAELTRDNAYILAADEDFGPTGLRASTDDDGEFVVMSGSATPPVGIGTTITGRARYVGRACDGDPAVPAARGARFAVVSRGTCTFTEKLRKIEAKGYAAVIVVNTEGRAGCGWFRMAVRGGIPAFSVERSVGFRIFDLRGYDDVACVTGSAEALPLVRVGALGNALAVRAYFDGWGYVHLFRNGTGKLKELDTYAISEAMQPEHRSGSGDLSVHEVATSLVRDDLAYLSYYAGGLRVVRIEDGRLVEAGRFIDVQGNNFWGVQVFHHAGREYVAASDMDFGLYIFRYTGD